MPLANPYQQYQHNAVHTADRGQLLIMTYEAIVRWLNRADAAIDTDNVVAAHEGLVNAQQLIRDLASSLDFDRGGEVANNLAALYDYMLDRLVLANVQKDKAIIDEIRRLVTPLLEAWRVAVTEARRQKQPPAMVS